MEIVKANLSHLHLISPLFDAYRQFYRQESDLEAARDFVKERIEKDESIIYLAMEGEDVACGFTQLYPVFSSVSMKRAWLLNDLYVAENHRRKGVASQLLQTAVKLGKETASAFIFLETESINKNAQEAYVKNGFVKTDNHFYFYTV